MHDWIEKLPELDKMALTDLVQGNFANLAKPRTMVFALYDVKDTSQLSTITKVLEDAGWQANSQPDPEQPSMFMLEAKKDGYVIDEKAYLTDTKFFADIAKQHEIHYDGWYASQE